MLSRSTYGFWLALIGLFLLSGCQQFEVPDPDGPLAPIFSAEGQLDGTAVSFDADGESFDALSNYSIDSLGVYSYTGELRSVGCEVETCGPRLTVRVRGTEDIDAGLTARPYPVRTPDPEKERLELYTVTISPEVFGNVQTCEWLIDGTETVTTNGTEPLILERTSEDPTSFTLSVTASFVGGCQSFIEDVVYLPSHGCDVDIAVRNDGGYLFTFDAITEGQDAFDYFWEFDDSVFASSSEVFYPYSNIPASGIDHVRLVAEGNGCTVQSRLNQIIEPASVDCNVNFSYSIETEFGPEVPVLDLATVEVEYVNEQGELFQSNLVDQPGWASFEVLEVVNYYDNLIDRDQRNKSVRARFSVLLGGVSGEIEMRDMDMTLPMGLGL